MNRWSKPQLVARAQAHFMLLYQEKKLNHCNHDIHFLYRDTRWLEQGVEQLLAGNYHPQCIERLYFGDGACDSLRIEDRVMQRLIYEVLKPTLKHVINPQCYHLQGPQGVRAASADIRNALTKKKHHYFIRTDIKSYYASIHHESLISDINACYSDKRLVHLLTQVIKTPIKTNKGFINPDRGISIRSPLSGVFSGLYLKSVDDCFTACDVDYFRYQDDVLILCPTYRSWKRCQSRLKRLVDQKHLVLAPKKTKMGPIEQGFHFLGIDYLGTQPPDKFSISPGVDKESTSRLLRTLFHQYSEKKTGDEASASGAACIERVPHERTIRRARERVRVMVADGASHQKIRTYLSLWASWWHIVEPNWSKTTLLSAWRFLCWDNRLSYRTTMDYPQYYSTISMTC